MSDPVRVVVLGNSFGARAQLPALRWAGQNRVVGLAGASLEKARRTAAEWDVGQASGEWRELLELEPDLVLVTTPVDLHHEMTLAAFEAGAAVVCEKPFALHAREARELVEAAGVAAQRGRGAWIDHELRFGPEFRRAKELVTQGRLGEAWYGRCEMFLPPSADYFERPHRWWYDQRRGGGMLGALGSHMIDLVRWLWGDVAQVSCTLATFLPERPDDDGQPRRVTADEHASLRLRFAGGGFMDLVTSVVVPERPAFDLQLVGSAGSLRLLEGTQLVFTPRGGTPEPQAVEPPLPTADELGMPAYGLFGRCLPLFLREVIQAVAQQRTLVPGAASFEDGLAVQRVLDAARASDAADGGWLRSS